MSERGGENIQGLNLPESLGRLQRIDNLRKKEPDNLTGWRNVEYDGVNGKITSSLVEVEVEGVKTRLRLLTADFREEGNNSRNIVVNCCGFPGLNEDVRREFLTGKFDGSFSQASLDIDGIARAARERGVLFIPELFVLPIDRRKLKQSFKTDAGLIAAGIEKISEEFDGSIVSLNKADSITLIGISNGAGEAGALAAQLSEGNKDLKILLRMYSLIGVVPVPDMVSAFSKEIWSVAMLEVAERFRVVYKQSHDVTNLAGQKALLVSLLGVLRTNEGRVKFVDQVRKSLLGGQEGGNLQVGIDMIKKIMKDVPGLLPHLGKFDNPDYLPDIGPNVEAELVVPKFDGVFRDKLQQAILSGAKEAGVAKETREVLEETMSGLIAVTPGKWLRELLPKAGKVSMAVLGENLADPLARHTGPLTRSREFIDVLAVEI